VISAKRALIPKRLRRAVLAFSLLALCAAVLPAAAGAVTPGPAWQITKLDASPTNFIRGDASGSNVYVILVTNVGSKDAGSTNADPITITDTLPTGLSFNPNPTNSSTASGTGIRDEGPESGQPCDPGPPVRCTVGPDDPEIRTPIHPGEGLIVVIPVNVAADAPPTVTNHVSVSSFGTPSVSASVQTTINSEPAPFGIQSFDSALFDAGGATETRAGAHPYRLDTGAQFNNILGREVPAAGSPDNITADLPAGLVLNPRATPVRCTEIQFETEVCPDSAAVGIVRVVLGYFGGYANPALTQPLYNLQPPAGVPAAFGFNVTSLGIFIHLLGRVRNDGDYGLSSDAFDTPQFGSISGVTVDLWGNPSDPSHDFRRGRCAYVASFQNGESLGFGSRCPVAPGDTPLLTMPSACSGPLVTGLRADSWQNRGSFVSATSQSEDAAGNPVGVKECDKLSYNPANETVLSTDQAETGTALDFDLDFANDGWGNTNALAESTTKKAVVALPEGVTINPSVGEGLGFCTPAQYAKERTFSSEGEGCPGDSKLGTLHLTTPLLDEGIDGSVYLAQQDDPTTTTPGAENPFDSDIALYMVLRNPQNGLMVKKPIKVEADPVTGQLTASIDEIPQFPFNHFSFHFKEGARAALISPPACGKYTTVAKFYPYSDPTNPKTVRSGFEIAKGVHGGPCPPGGIPPFHPAFLAGSVNNNAKSYSPFNMRLTRADGEQDMTKFSAILPPGVLGKLAGVSKCPDSAIAAAKAKTGGQEKASPSCPANSLIGHTLAGAGVGGSLTYVPGQLYLGGPYHGDPLSVVSITPALAGPFDAGTVVVREALTLNPETAEVIVDGKNSDPIPHILKGIVLKVRDLRVYVDKPEFIVNPTNCEPTTAKSTLFGAYLNVFDPSDDVPVGLDTRYQAANCLNLPFKPRLTLELHGGTRRGDHPALKAVVNAKPGDANIGKAVVTLPQSAFLDQAHIRTICTRVQFAANGGAGGGCPKAAQYGYAKAITPLLDEPVEGPVYLRSSNHKLPDLVAALHGIVNVDIVGRIDSYKGGIRSSFETVPDAPVTRFTLNMQGGKKGLVVNSRNLCAGTNRGIANFTGQNGVPYNFKPVVKPSCGKKRKGAKHGKK
jgi:hypothetical protein